MIAAFFRATVGAGLDIISRAIAIEAAVAELARAFEAKEITADELAAKVVTLGRGFTRQWMGEQLRPQVAAPVRRRRGRR